MPLMIETSAHKNESNLASNIEAQASFVPGDVWGKGTKIAAKIRSDSKKSLAKLEAIPKNRRPRLRHWRQLGWNFAGGPPILLAILEALFWGLQRPFEAVFEGAHAGSRQFVRRLGALGADIGGKFCRLQPASEAIF